jgi:hypothetical protein
VTTLFTLERTSELPLTCKCGLGGFQKKCKVVISRGMNEMCRYLGLSNE